MIQVLFQNQWGGNYGDHIQVIDLSVWFWGFQFVVMNFRLYVRIKRSDDEY